MEMGMDIPKALQAPGPGSKTSEIGDENALIIAHDHIFHIPPPSYKERYLSLDVGRDLP